MPTARGQPQDDRFGGVILPLLVIEHETDCPPAWMGEWLEGAGVRLDVRRPYAGEPLPEDLDGHSGLMVLGGSMGADRRRPLVARSDKELVRLAAARRVPTLGICLGHQLCAVALGGAIVVNPRGQQVGVLDVGWLGSAAEDPLMRDLPRPAGAVQWNNDVVARPPDGTVALAATPTGELQAARFAPTVWGVQWHPEAGEEIISRWVTDDERLTAAARGIDLDAYLRDVGKATGQLRATWVRLAESFAGLLRDAEVRTVQ